MINNIKLNTNLVSNSHSIKSYGGYSQLYEAKVSRAAVCVCVRVHVSPVHVNEKEVIPSNEIETNSSSTKRHQHHLCHTKG